MAGGNGGGRGGDKGKGKGMEGKVKKGRKGSTCILKQRQKIIRNSYVSMKVRFHLGTIEYMALQKDDL